VSEGLVVRGRWPVGEGNVEEEQVDCYHEERLYEEGGGEVRAEPVVYSVREVIVSRLFGDEKARRLNIRSENILQYTSNQHDQRYVHGEAGRRARLVDRVYLVRIAGYGACRYAVACSR
jgi:hypothetical protein